jgi:multiple sugar transport system ATP-binding protein
MSGLTFEGVGKTFPDGTRAVNELDLHIPNGKFAVLVGPSGCGKTTALRMVAGLEEVTDGVIKIGDRIVNYLPPRERDVAMVFQNYALYPQMNVFDNIGFGLKMRKVPKHELRERVVQIARMLDLEELLDRKPGNLSGGQRQRVAMGRAIAREPQLFLMDEPLSNLDAKLRVHMRAEIARLQREVGVTTLYVTHDQVEAMTMGAMIAVMRRGELQQYGPPQELYAEPVNLFVATFLGSPAMNVLRGRLARSNGSLTVAVGESELRLPEQLIARSPGLTRYEGRDVGVGLRPEHLHPGAVDGGASLRGSVVVVEALGAELLAHIEVAAEQVVSEEILEGTVGEDEEGALVGVGADTSRTTLIGRFAPETRIAPGERIEVGVDATRLHIFDLDTGLVVGG